MNCVKCGGTTRVVDTCADKDTVYRKRKCTSCGLIIYSTEQLATENVQRKIEKLKYYRRIKGEIA